VQKNLTKSAVRHLSTFLNPKDGEEEKYYEMVSELFRLDRKPIEEGILKKTKVFLNVHPLTASDGG
jgi:hypothetical protein